jgi:hypothetical protein
VGGHIIISDVNYTGYDETIHRCQGGKHRI